jgi:hypothetical protein
LSGYNNDLLREGEIEAWGSASDVGIVVSYTFGAMGLIGSVPASFTASILAAYFDRRVFIFPADDDDISESNA